MESANSWLRSPTSIRQEREFRLNVGSVDLMPKACHGKREAEITAMLVDASKSEKARVFASLNETQITASAESHFRELTDYLASDDPKWKDIIPGKPLLAKFASKANIGLPRLKTMYVHFAEMKAPSPFAEIHSIFDAFANS